MLVLAGLVLLASATAARGDNWPQWRGIHGDGISRETNLPVSWSRDNNVAWRLPLPGPAGATPVVWGDRIFLTSAAGRDLVLMCISTEGKELWRRQIGSGNQEVRGDEGNSASPSPCTDGQFVWSFLGNGALACHTVDGEPVWNLDVPSRYGKLNIAFGLTSSPVLDGDRLYLQLIHGDGNPATREALVVALDKKTGREIWQQARPSDARAECEHSYASPVLYRDEQRSLLLTHGADYVVAHDPDSGRELWRCGDLNPKGKYNDTLRFVASPAVAPGVIVVPSAKNGPVFCLRPDLKGDVTESPDAFFWKRPQGTPDVPSPLIHDGLVYLCRENGNLVCVDARTGEQFYEQRTEPDRHRASPVWADGKLYLTARRGVVTVVKAGRKFEILSSNALNEEMSASPAIAHGRIYLRTFGALYAIGK
ncbi:MAG: PQQ-binding-like beta-propeller repeat protein [Pirellulales bacterium]